MYSINRHREREKRKEIMRVCINSSVPVCPFCFFCSFPASLLSLSLFSLSPVFPLTFLPQQQKRLFSSIFSLTHLPAVAMLDFCYSYVLCLLNLVVRSSLLPYLKRCSLFCRYLSDDRSSVKLRVTGKSKSPVSLVAIHEALPVMVLSNLSG